MMSYLQKLRKSSIRAVRRSALLIVTAVFLPAVLPAQAQPAQSGDSRLSTMSSSSTVDWVQSVFSSAVTLDVEKAGIPLPSGKSSAVNRINMQLPILIKDPLLSLAVNSSLHLSDVVLRQNITLEQLTGIIADGKRTPGVFADGGTSLRTTHAIRLQNIGALMIRHHTPYTPDQPIDRISTRAYTGIIIDARGQLPVQGEYTESTVEPCFFPEIWDETMELLYERNMDDPDVAVKQGIVAYDWSEDESRYQDRIGTDPLRIRARKVYGANRTDPVITRNDALRILTIDANRELLRQGRIVILLDKEQLIHQVAAPVKDTVYYTAYGNLRDYLYVNKVPGVIVTDTDNGMKIAIQDLKFVPDSAELLAAEKSRIRLIADSLKKATATTGYTILVEGHTADVNKPNGQLTLSIKRAQAIVNELVGYGLPRSLFSYKGYGGTVPIADNSTEKGRAENRRVEITVIPRTTYVQRAD